MKLALDSNIFIAFLQVDDEFFAASKELLEGISQNNVKAIFSTLVYGEVMYGSPPNSSLKAVKSFFNSLAGASEIPADKEVCFKAAELRQKYGSLKLPDAIHLATAIIGGVDIFITADMRLVNIADQQIKTIMLGKPINA